MFFTNSIQLVIRAALLALTPLLASDSIPLTTGTWTPIGPAPTIDGGTGYFEPTGGRITCIAPDPSDPNTLYIGAAGGGVWKTIDGGISWTPLTDAMPSLFIGALAVAPSNPQVIYTGTGEANNGPSKTRAKRFNIYSGRGILKSADGGQTWTQLGADVFDRRTFSRIAVQPDNADIVYAAVGAQASEGLPGNTGVWKSTDGGSTWSNITARISTTIPVSDILIDPGNYKRLFAAFGAPGGAAVNNVYQSNDAGATWAVVNLTGTQAKYGRISLAITGTNVYAVVAEASATSNSLWGLYKSSNSGLKWSKLPISVNDKFCPEFGTVSNVLAVAGDYHQALAVDPANPSNIYLAGLCIIGSTDGGNSWSVLGDGESGGPHHDHHALAFDASGLLLNGNAAIDPSRPTTYGIPWPALAHCSSPVAVSAMARNSVANMHRPLSRASSSLAAATSSVALTTAPSVSPRAIRMASSRTVVFVRAMNSAAAAPLSETSATSIAKRPGWIQKQSYRSPPTS